MNLIKIHNIILANLSKLLSRLQVFKERKNYQKKNIFFMIMAKILINFLILHLLDNSMLIFNMLIKI